MGVDKNSRGRYKQKTKKKEEEDGRTEHHRHVTFFVVCMYVFPNPTLDIDIQTSLLSIDHNFAPHVESMND